MAPAPSVGGAGYAMVFSTRLQNSFVQLLDRELCPFQVRGGGVGRLSSSSITTAIPYIERESDDINIYYYIRSIGILQFPLLFYRTESRTRHTTSRHTHAH